MTALRTPPQMTSKAVLLALCATGLVLSGCGRKGPLELPVDPASQGAVQQQTPPAAEPGPKPIETSPELQTPQSAPQSTLD